ncbi:ABC transporter permease [Gammaproteobacteria bacterium]|nr:ABC transporter permease [Gammaproteobacteria bacterium]
MIGLMTLIRRETGRILRLWQQTLVPPAITSALYFIIFGSIIGKKVGTMSGLPFIYFIAPGLVMMSVVIQSYQNVCSVVYIEKFQKSMEELLVSPLSYHEILLGYMSGGVLRGVLTGGVVFFVAECFLNIDIAHPILMVCILLFSAMLFSLIGLLNGLWSNSFDHTVFIPTFILTPLIYLGGVFYSIEALPAFWQPLIMWNPIFYLISLLRYAFYDILMIDAQFAMVVLAFMIMVVYGGAYYVMSQTQLVRK